ncbi:MAG TPA: glycoside hydrolase family 38 C-terminal domain-containing protein [Propionibacteriaceae bacterium]|nr:glycoside hydrolase family 38 C-terminal domain-containing protein [Propionibacteriaceae bacterium]
MHRDLANLPARIDRAHRRIKDHIWSHRTPCRLEAHHLPGEPRPFADIKDADFEEFHVDSPWGRGWSTSWFRITATIPDGLPAGKRELVINPGYSGEGPGFQCEGLVYELDGTPIKGIHPRNQYVPVPKNLQPGDEWTVLLEAASNPAVHSGRGLEIFSDLDTTPDKPLYWFQYADLGVLDDHVFGLDLDISVLNELQGELPAGHHRKQQIMTGLEQALDTLDLRDIPATAAAAREVLAPLLAAPASASEHTVSAVGHAHIDSAWLWPIRETVRKCARTFSNITHLATDYPETVFGCSQQVQYAWMRDKYPAVYDRIKQAAKNGTWAPISGMWVEPDGNLPGGEAFARQFLYGKKLVEDDFGTTVDEVWLPDTFGYSAALPQICRLAEASYFMSQKMSWNKTNVFPHHTFWWEGIDGTRIFTHFPPSDTYNAEMRADEVHRSRNTFKDSGPANHTMMAFGYGDGGGGPTREMLEKARRLADLEGSPKVVVETPNAFFTKAIEEYPNAPVWVGEMYLEFHRGTYTTHVKTKQGNRRTEHLLFEAELWCATAALQVGYDYPYDEIDDVWREALLLQFHDILPGSSIRWVHREAHEKFEELRVRLEAVIAGALDALGSHPGKQLVGERGVANASPFPQYGVAAFGAAAGTGVTGNVSVDRSGDEVVLDNGLLRATVAADGTVRSLVDLTHDREILPEGSRGALLQLHPDHPNQYEAWDIESFYRNVTVDLTDVDSLDVDGDAVVVKRHFDDSAAVTRISLAPDQARLDVTVDVDWHERERLLKLAFPLDIHSATYTSEIQYGHVTRPAHANTSWEAAMFETAAQRWVHVGEPGYGVAVVNRGTYGHDISRPTGQDGRGSEPTTVRLSLVRGPLYPDPRADEGEHSFTVSLLAGADIPAATEAGYAAALPVRHVTSTWEPVVATSNPAVVISAVKLAEDRSGDVIVRLYESLGGRAATTVTYGFEAGETSVVNLLERQDGMTETLAHADPVDGGVKLALKPFQIVTLRVKRA